MMRENLTGFHEVQDIVIADVVLIIAMTLTLSGGIFAASGGASKFASSFLLLLPITTVGVSLSFILHELMHRFVANKYGAIAGFQTSYVGLMITLVTGAFGFLLGIPGATMIYAHNFTKRENGIVSIAGPLTNFVVFAAALILSFVVAPATGSYLGEALYFIIFISILLAFFNMLPLYPLDGSKVLAWSKPVYFATMGTIFILMLFFTPIPLSSLIFMLVIALFFSIFYRVRL